MGLDITVHTKVEQDVAPLLDEYGDIDYDAAYSAGKVKAWVCHEAFAASYDGLPGDPVEGAWVTSTGPSWSFRAGSYSGYNAWRSALARAAWGVEPQAAWADPDAYRDRPFYLLINFADNEGCIGPQACAVLAEQFDSERDRIVPLLDEWEAKLYETWSEAFHNAAGSGMVEFG